MSGCRQLTIQQRMDKFIEHGILPSDDISTFSSTQKEIYNEISTNKLTYEQLIYKYLDYANIKTKRLYVHKRINHKKSMSYFKNKGTTFDISPEDIIMNEYCPFFGNKIIYASDTEKKIGGTFRNPSFYSIDRIDNSKGYVKGNVWIISRLANTIKLDSTIDELKKFCKNIIKQHTKII